MGVQVAMLNKWFIINFILKYDKITFLQNIDNDLNRIKTLENLRKKNPLRSWHLSLKPNLAICIWMLLLMFSFEDLILVFYD